MESLMRLPAVMQRVGLSRSTIYLYISRGLFPKPIRITPGVVGWPSTAIDVWIKAKLESAPVSNLNHIGEETL